LIRILDWMTDKATSLVLLVFMNKLIRYAVYKIWTWVSGNACGVPKCWEGESFMDLIEASMKEEAGQHVHGWENITLPKEEIAIANKLLA
jgi:hypothetical protein